MFESFKNFDNFKTLIRKRPKYEILLIWHKLRRTDVTEVDHWAKVSNKTANINVQNHSLYASQGQIQEFAKGGPVPLVPFTSPFRLSLPSPSPLEVGPLKPARGSGGAL